MTRLREIGFLNFINHREEIRLIKETDTKPPWTLDDRLRDYWFPNINREHDPFTKWLRFNTGHSLLGKMVGRVFAKQETCAPLIDHIFRFGFSTSALLDIVGPMDKPFNSRVYYLTFPPSLSMVADTLGDFMGQEISFKNSSPDHAWNMIQRVRGIGPDIAYEVVRDSFGTTDWAAPTTASVRGAGTYLEEDFSSSRADDCLQTMKLIRKLSTETGWTQHEIHRALSLFHVYLQPDNPKRRYRWTS